MYRVLTIIPSIMGWTKDAAQNMVNATAADYKYHFYAVNGALGSAGDKPACTPKDADPNHGTSDYAKSVSQMSQRSVMGWTSRSRMARP
jgi:hypothetical protein